MSHNFEFSTIEWTEVAVGFRYKAYVHDHQQIRLVEFSDGFCEPDWCRNGHFGYVIDGECKISFDGTVEWLKKGDVIHIQAGEEDKHMLIMEKGGWIQVILFDHTIDR